MRNFKISVSKQWWDLKEILAVPTTSVIIGVSKQWWDLKHYGRL